MAAKINNLQELQKVMNNSILKIEAQIVKYEDFDLKMNEIARNMDETVSNVKESIEKEAPKLWSEVIKTSPANPPVVTATHLKKALEEVAELDKEQELRSKGIVIYRLPESSAATTEARKTEDISKISEMLKFIKCDEAQIVYSERLGRFDASKLKENKYRPVKVRFLDNATRNNVLKNLFRLGDAPENIKTLSIRQDLNEAQREVLRNIMDEAKTKSRASSTHFYKVKGVPGNYRMVEVPKKEKSNTK